MPVKIVMVLLALSISPALARTCVEQEGPDRADGQVAQCKAASMSPNPVCNKNNDCDTISGGTWDGCSLRRQRHASAPSFCPAWLRYPRPTPNPE